MESFILQSLLRALSLLVKPDTETLGIIALSLVVSGSAVAGAGLLGIALAAFLALRRPPLSGALLSVLNTFMGLPPVVVGLGLYLVLSRSGPLGALGLLYSPYAMVLAQFILAFPIVAALAHSAIQAVDPAVADAATALGATPLQRSLKVLQEARYGIISALMAALGRVMAEVGAVLVVGGNIKGYTRVMTTTIAMEAEKGDFVLAIALGIVLLGISLGINTALYWLQRRGRRP